MPDDDARRSIPSVDSALRALRDVELPRPLVARVVRETLDAARRGELAAGDAVDVARERLASLAASRLRPVINATGVILHTNLGRAPLGDSAARAVAAAAANFSSLEFDLQTGERGGRGAYLEAALAALCDAPAATLVNNCAAALVLMLADAAREADRRHVLISRGELVQIGGGFRVPEIIEASGATLREVGTTNRTTADDFRRALDAGAAAILAVHRSNFHMSGFVESPTTADLAAVARAANVPLLCDVGSGATFDTRAVGDGVEREPTAAAALRDGATLACFSGDKLLGGPQAGVIAGDAASVHRLKRAPLFRALRCDKLAFAAMEATVDALLRGDVEALPARAMMGATIDSLERRAREIVTRLGGAIDLAMRVSEAKAGGGTLPMTRIPSVALHVRVEGRSAAGLAATLRRGSPPIVGTIIDGQLRLDLRTVFASQDEAVIAALRALGTGT